jgi:amino acid transporter
VGGSSQSAIINVFQIAFGDNIAAIEGVSVLLIINLFFAGFSSLTVTSRIMFAIARDGGFPFSEFLSQVNKTT